ncbi:MAG TPA: BON domain-containing protein [Micromonosporaceae bacterium]|nr:BON domain-containing protein [Micromonosporaceae bacterium]
MTTASTIRSDEDLQRDVLAELAWDAQIQPNEIGVVVAEGVVTLTGWVESYARKWAAEQAAHRVRGVRAVANDVQVRLTGSAERTDEEIALAATRGLEWDSFVPVERLDVTVSNGWLMLRGEVEWHYQKRAAERAVRRMSGVRGVTNLINVRPHPTPSRDDLSGRIRDALMRSAETDADLITIEVMDDTVVLQGTVRSWSERQEAERIAWSAPGVAEVESRLTVAT